MKRVFSFLLLILLTGVILSNVLSQEKSGKEERETFLDQRVHIEKDLILR